MSFMMAFGKMYLGNIPASTAFADVLAVAKTALDKVIPASA